MITGLLYYTYNQWPEWGLDSVLSLGAIAFIHLIIVFMILSFLIVHVYMTTTGHSLFSHIWAMISGWEEIYETTEIHDWETAGKNTK
ncbi:cytochrome B, partial [Desulfobacterales bacterium HSG17]|nr:cytochrome B [Desulfobacterales bacterium HSG17]